MEPRPYYTHHLIKSEDLNHHGTLYAGRSAEWFVEAGFIATASHIPPKNIVCLQIHGMIFTRPVHLGEVVCYESKIVYTGRTSVIAYIKVISHDEKMLDGFITFINVDEKGCAQPHGVEITPVTEEDQALFEQGKALAAKKK